MNAAQQSATLVGRTFSRWSDHEGQRLGAALAFYTLLSAAPLMIFLLLAVSTFYGTDLVEKSLINYAQSVVGGTAAQLVQTFFASAHRPAHGTLAGIFAITTLLFGASGAFSELRDDLNKMWDASPRSTGLFGILIQRAFAFLLVLAAGVLLLGLILLSTAVALIGKFFQGTFPIPPVFLDIVNFLVSFVVLMLVAALVFRYVPDRKLPWSALRTGAAVSAILLVIGKAALGWYLGKAGVGSAYGAAGSVVAVAFWIYYSAQIFLLGAEFTYVWALHRHHEVYENK